MKCKLHDKEQEFLCEQCVRDDQIMKDTEEFKAGVKSMAQKSGVNPKLLHRMGIRLE